MTFPRPSMDGDAPPPAARILGYAGLLPNLVALGWALAVRGRPDGALLGYALAMSAQIYAALILSFLGGMWWGVAALRVAPDRLWGWLIAAVIPSLYAAASFVSAWVAPPPRGIAVMLGAGLLLSLYGDARLARDGLVPRWWMLLRVPLSVGLAVETVAVGLLV